MKGKPILEIVNGILLPVKLLIPQPIIARIPGLTTNEEIRINQVLHHTEGRLLDIGCGRNLLVQGYREGGGGGVGVDVYQWDGVDQVVADTAKLPFDSNEFDTITFVACINHIPNRDLVLTEAHRLLKAGGRVVLTNLPPMISLIWHKIAFWDEDQHERGMAEGEVWGLKKDQMEELFNNAGFQVTHYSRFSWGLNELYVAVSR